MAITESQAISLWNRRLLLGTGGKPPAPQWWLPEGGEGGGGSGAIPHWTRVKARHLGASPQSPSGGFLRRGIKLIFVGYVCVFTQ